MDSQLRKWRLCQNNAMRALMRPAAPAELLRSEEHQKEPGTWLEQLWSWRPRLTSHRTPRRPTSEGNPGGVVSTPWSARAKCDPWLDLRGSDLSEEAWSDSDLRNLEARSEPWAVCHHPQVIPEQPVWCGLFHVKEPGVSGFIFVVLIRCCTALYKLFLLTISKLYYLNI